MADVNAGLCHRQGILVTWSPLGPGHFFCLGTSPAIFYHSKLLFLSDSNTITPALRLGTSKNIKTTRGKKKGVKSFMPSPLPLKKTTQPFSTPGRPFHFLYIFCKDTRGEDVVWQWQGEDVLSGDIDTPPPRTPRRGLCLTSAPPSLTLTQLALYLSAEKLRLEIGLPSGVGLQEIVWLSLGSSSSVKRLKWLREVVRLTLDRTPE